MSKTDKELATELTIAVINSWNSIAANGHAKGMTVQDSTATLKEFLKTLNSADDDK